MLNFCHNQNCFVFNEKENIRPLRIIVDFINFYNEQVVYTNILILAGFTITSEPFSDNT